MHEIFIFLKHKLDARQWRNHHAAGLVADRSPYGYHLAEGDGYRITFSESRREWCCLCFLRRLLRKILQIDIIHAWRNRHLMFKSHIIWTHTEHEFLAVLLLFHFLKPSPRPKLIGQSIWLADDWPHLTAIKKRLYRNLAKEAEVLTFHTQLGLSKIQTILKHNDCRLVKFGVSLHSFPFCRKPLTCRAERPIRIASLGNDCHRDWTGFLAAFGNQDSFSVRIASRTLTQNDVTYHGNMTVKEAKSVAELHELYGWADLVVLCLQPNSHASGLTVICEAIHCGTPVVCTDTGDLRTYFSDHHICYVPPGNPDLVRQTARTLANDHKRCQELVDNAQALLVQEKISSQGFALRHLEISKDLLNC